MLCLPLFCCYVALSVWSGTKAQDLLQVMWIVFLDVTALLVAFFDLTEKTKELWEFYACHIFIAITGIVCLGLAGYPINEIQTSLPYVVSLGSIPIVGVVCLIKKMRRIPDADVYASI